MHSIFVSYSVILCMMKWAFFNINIHDYCCDGQKRIEAKEKYASDIEPHSVYVEKPSADTREEKTKAAEMNLIQVDG